jgi:NTE family protein
MLFNFLSKPAKRSTIGLILTGGGARAAYQAGVLAGIARLLPTGAPSPFRVICGTSAGALNAAIIAQDAGHFALGVKRAVNAWATLNDSSVHRSDLGSVARHVARWAWTALAGDKHGRPVSLLDNTPLRELVPRLVDFSCVRAAIRANHLDALSITASSYRTGQSLSFFEGNESLQPWSSARRGGVRATLGPEHVLGSMAIPFMYPPERIGDDHFGDGAIQQLSPISPAIHLGAEKVLIIGVGRCSSAGAILDTSEAYPSIAQISGHLFDSIFADTLESDLERIRQVNQMLALIPAKVRERAGLEQREVETWVMNPRQSLEELAAIRVHRLPTSLRLLLRAIGALRDGRASVLSYVLTEEWYCRSLIRRGFRDAMVQRKDIAEFLEIPLVAQRVVRHRTEATKSRDPKPKPLPPPVVTAPVSSPVALPLQA